MTAPIMKKQPPQIDHVHVLFLSEIQKREAVRQRILAKPFHERNITLDGVAFGALQAETELLWEAVRARRIQVRSGKQHASTKNAIELGYRIVKSRSW